MPSQTSKDCDRHAGHINEDRRSGLDHVMRRIPENQSGVGRHKCPYCAYHEGYRQALADALGHLNRLNDKEF